MARSTGAQRIDARSTTRRGPWPNRRASSLSRPPVFYNGSTSTNFSCAVITLIRERRLAPMRLWQFPDSALNPAQIAEGRSRPQRAGVRDCLELHCQA